MADNRDEYAKAWELISRSLGDLGGRPLEDARAWIGDRAFIRLSDQFDPGAIVVACGIANADELLEGYGPARPRGKMRDGYARLVAAVDRAHDAIGPHPPRSECERAIARKALDDLVARDRKH